MANDGEIDLDNESENTEEAKPRQVKSFKRSVKKTIEAEPVSQVAPEIPQETNEDKISRLLNELFSCSLNERRKLILAKYSNEMKKFRDQVGSVEFESVLNEFMKEKIEGKVLAALHSTDDGK